MSAQELDYIIGQAVVLILGVLGYLSNRRATAGVKSDVKDVHSLVNNQLDRQLDRNAQLTRTLTGAGVDVPLSPTAAEDERMARPGNGLQ
jgi:sensor domain CHASE-containing protein